MALFKYSQHLSQSADDAFDTLYTPGATTPHSGGGLLFYAQSK